MAKTEGASEVVWPEFLAEIIQRFKDEYPLP